MEAYSESLNQHRLGSRPRELRNAFHALRQYYRAHVVINKITKVHYISDSCLTFKGKAAPLLGYKEIPTDFETISTSMELWRTSARASKQRYSLKSYLSLAHNIVHSLNAIQLLHCILYMVDQWQYQTDVSIQVSRVVTESTEIALNILEMATAPMEGRVVLLNTKCGESNSDVEGISPLSRLFLIFFSQLCND